MDYDVETRLYRIFKNNQRIRESGIEITPNINLTNLGLDSVNYLEIIVAIEDEFGINFTDSDLTISNIKSFKELIAFIKFKMSANGNQ